MHAWPITVADHFGHTIFALPHGHKAPKCALLRIGAGVNLFFGYMVNTSDIGDVYGVFIGARLTARLCGIGDDTTIADGVRKGLEPFPCSILVNHGMVAVVLPLFDIEKPMAVILFAAADIVRLPGAVNNYSDNLRHIISINTMQNYAKTFGIY